MKSQFKIFHFKELDWLIYFPDSGNKGKYVDYIVTFRDRKDPKGDRQVILGELVSKTEFENCFPHTVGFFKTSFGEGIEFKPDYMEIRIIRSLDDFWLFLNALNI